MKPARHSRKADNSQVFSETGTHAGEQTVFSDDGGWAEVVCLCLVVGLTLAAPTVFSVWTIECGLIKQLLVHLVVLVALALIETEGCGLWPSRSLAGWLVAVLTALAVWGGSARGADENHPSVVLITLDALRADHLGCYGYAKDTSPHLDSLAKEGVLLENVVAASSWTIPSQMSVFTGIYPSAHTIEDSSAQLPKGVATLAEVLSRNGYRTVGFVTGPPLSHVFGFGRGFQIYDDFSVMLDMEMSGQEVPDGGPVGINDAPTNPTITRMAVNWLRKNREEKFFLFLHYWDCHCDYIPPAPYDRRYDPGYAGDENGRRIMQRAEMLEKGVSHVDLSHLVALYDGEVAHTDAHVGIVLDALRELGIADRTLVVVLGDHGEAFMEHGRLLHGNSLYEELIHVPWIMRSPGRLPSRTRIQGAVSHVDVMPTILGVLGLDAPQRIHGRDLSVVCRNGGMGMPLDRVVFSELALRKRMRAAIRGVYKIIWEEGQQQGLLLTVGAGGERVVSPTTQPTTELPAVWRNLFLAVQSGPELRNDSQNSAPPLSAERDDVIKRLRSLGYMQ